MLAALPSCDSRFEAGHTATDTSSSVACPPLGNVRARAHPARSLPVGMPAGRICAH